MLGADGWQFAAALVDDVRALLSCGRPAIVCAITDLRRMFAAAVEEAKGSERALASCGRQGPAKDVGALETLTYSSAASDRTDALRTVVVSLPTQQQQPQVELSESQRDSEQHTDMAQGSSSSRHSTSQAQRHPAGRPKAGQGMGNKRLRAQLQASERKLAFFQSWANEQSRDAYQHILEATVEVMQTFQHTTDSPVASRAAAEIVGCETRGAQPLGGGKQQRPMVEELSERNDARSLIAEAVSSGEGCPGNGHAASELDYDALD